MCSCRVAVGVAVLYILSTVNIPFRSHVSDLCPRGVIISFLFSLEPVYHSTFLFSTKGDWPWNSQRSVFSQDMRAKLSSCLWYQNYDYVWNMFVDLEKREEMKSGNSTDFITPSPITFWNLDSVTCEQQAPWWAQILAEPERLIIWNLQKKNHGKSLKDIYVYYVGTMSHKSRDEVKTSKFWWVSITKNFA